MGTAVIILILLIIAIIAVKSYAKKLTSGCCGAGGDKERKIHIKDKDVSHYPYTASISISGMTCKHCKERVENALNAEEGVWAEVDLKNGSALVRMKNKLPEMTLRSDIIKAGYSVTSFSEQQ